MKRGLASPWVHSALPMTRRARLQLSRVRPAEVLEPPRRLAARFGLAARGFASRPRSRPPAARCAPGRTRNPPGSPRTTPSAPRGRSRCRRAAECAPAASGHGSGRRCGHLLHRAGRGIDVRTGAASPPADAGRRRCTAADSSSSRSSRERSGPPDGRAADRRWHRGRA